MNGGYLMVSKTDTDLYAKLVKGLTIGKPILWYESPTECYYIDTISGGEVTSEIIDDEEVFTYHDIVLTKGGKTITITSSNVVTESGNIQNHLYTLTFNVSDMYYTIFTRISCAMNDKVINDGEDEPRTMLTLTDEEKKSLYNAYKSALLSANNHLLGSISGDTVGYINYSTLTGLQFINSDNDGYSIEITFNNDDIVIYNNSNEDDITIYETQLF